MEPFSHTRDTSASVDSGRFPEHQPLVIIGLGNELLADDGVGIRVVRELQERLLADDIAFEELSVGGLQLLDYLVGHEHCIIVDAVMTGAYPPGTIYRFVQAPSDKPINIRLTSSHQIDLFQIVELAKLLKADIPRTITVYGIEPSDVTTFNNRCTGPVSTAIPQLVGLICRDLMDSNSGCRNQTVLVTESTPRPRMGNWEIMYQPVAEAASSNDSSSFV